MRKNSENVRKILQVTVQNVLSSSGENQRGIRVDTGKKVHGISQWQRRQKQKGSTVTDYNEIEAQCRSTSECSVRISWILVQELLSELL